MMDMWLRAICAQPLVFPMHGRMMHERPRPSPALANSINCSVRALTLQLIFSVALSVISFSARIIAVGMLLNPVQVIAELMTLHGALSLSWPTYALGLMFTLVCRVGFLGVRAHGQTRTL